MALSFQNARLRNHSKNQQVRAVWRWANRLRMEGVRRTRTSVFRFKWRTFLKGEVVKKRQFQCIRSDSGLVKVFLAILVDSTESIEETVWGYRQRLAFGDQIRTERANDSTGHLWPGTFRSKSHVSRNSWVGAFSGCHCDRCEVPLKEGELLSSVS